jgi:hypothetical protein
MPGQSENGSEDDRDRGPEPTSNHRSYPAIPRTHMCRYGRVSPVELAVFAGGAARMVGGVVPGVLEEIDADQRGRGGV